MNTYLNHYYTPFMGRYMPFYISQNLKMTTPKKVALPPPRRGRKNGAQAGLSSWMLFKHKSTSNSKWALKRTRDDTMHPTMSR